MLHASQTKSSIYNSALFSVFLLILTDSCIGTIKDILLKGTMYLTIIYSKVSHKNCIMCRQTQQYIVALSKYTYYLYI